MAKIALLIGVSEYEQGLSPLSAASNDVKALQQVLEDPNIGAFDRVIPLINPDLQGMKEQIETVFTGCHKDDLALLFFSGHGIKDHNNKLYLATPITNKNPKGELKLSTAVSAQFVHDIMNNSRAKRQAIILDCCFSGAFDPSLQAKDDGTFDLQGQLGAEGRVVLASSSSTQYSFEHKESDLSMYTCYLIEGLKTGCADQNKDGQVSILELHDYTTKKIQEKIPNVTPKIIVLKDKGFEIILARAKKQPKQDLEWQPQKVDLGTLQLGSNQPLEELDYYNPIPSLLQLLSPLIERLIEQYKSYYFSVSLNGSLPESRIFDLSLESIRIASDAEFVFIARALGNRAEWELKCQSRLESDKSDYAHVIKDEILANVSAEAIFLAGCHGIYRTYSCNNDASPKSFILIPLATLDEQEFIAICGLSDNSSYLNDVYTKIVSVFYKSSQNFKAKPERVEASILDELKREYGFLPLSLYNRRFELFQNRLEEIVIHFQPILDLDEVVISRWEALARDSNDMTTPVDLFDAAELWGRKFTTELDINLLEQAANRYRKSCYSLNKNRTSEIVPLSVNVYPESLMRRAYFDTVSKITQPNQERSLIPSKKLILEISEKSRLPTHDGDVRLKHPLKSFKEKLLEYKRKLKIQFGIDDFGVGHSSVYRLVGLNPPYVKIDRQILHLPHAHVIIRFVIEMVEATSGLKESAIIVEGVDSVSPMSLLDLSALGINYVQGYLVGEASPKIYRLSKEKYNDLRGQIYGDSL